jgi:flagellar basal-body rod modification protein FlgD
MSTPITFTGTSTTAQEAANTSARIPQKQLGQDDFLKLITVQLAKQDPMKPMEDTEFIAQMASFSALEAQNTLAKEMGFLRADAQMQGATNMIGREVEVSAASGPVTGVVDSISADENGVYVHVAGEKYAFSAVTSVRPAPTPPAAQTVA